MMNTKACLSTLLVAGLFVGLGELTAHAFIPINATYNGLFYEADGYWEQSSGTLSLKSTTRGSYSAKLQIGKARYSFSGQFDANGRVVKDILRRYDYPLRVEFQVNAEDPDLIEGTVSDGLWIADLIADRAVFDGKTSISFDAGQYTLVLLGSSGSSNVPGGESYGTITVSKNGRIRFAGSLADGTKITQSSMVSKDGLWPLYAPLYGGFGSLYSWMHFNTSNGEDLTGEITWIRPEMPSAWYYPDGFAIIVEALGSRYVRPPKGTKVLNVTNAEIQFNGGDLSRNFTNSVTLNDNNQIVNFSANGLSLSFSLSKGSFRGRVMDPITWEWIPFNGVVLQRFGWAAGYFPGWDQSGEVWLEGW